MDTEDTLFEYLQALSDNAEHLGLKDVALVLEFAMDVFLHEKAALTHKKEPPAPPSRPTFPDLQEPTYMLAQVYRHAS